MPCPSSCRCRPCDRTRCAGPSGPRVARIRPWPAAVCKSGNAASKSPRPLPSDVGRAAHRGELLLEIVDALDERLDGPVRGDWIWPAQHADPRVLLAALLCFLAIHSSLHPYSSHHTIAVLSTGSPSSSRQCGQHRGQPSGRPSEPRQGAGQSGWSQHRWSSVSSTTLPSKLVLQRLHVDAGP